MANIPTVPGSEMVQTQPRLVQASGALNATWGLQHLAKGIGEVASVVHDYTQQKQDAKNAMALADSDRLMRQSRVDFIESLRNDGDETTWEARAKESADKARQTIMDNHPELTPIVKKQLDAQFKNWGANFQNEIKVLAGRRFAQRAEAKFDSDVEEIAKDGDEQGAVSVINMAERMGIYHPDKAQKLRKQIPVKIERNQIENGIIQDPYKTLEQLKATTPTGRYQHFSAVDEVTRARAIVQAETAHKRNMANNTQGVLEDIQGGSVYTEDDLNEMVKANRISAKSVPALIRLQKQSTKQEDAYNSVSDLRKRIDSLDLTKPADKLKQDIYDIQTSPEWATIPAPTRSAMASHLKDIEKSKKPSPNIEARSYIRSLKSAGILGDYSSGTSEEKLKILKQEYDLMDRLEDFTSKNPQATDEQKRKQIDIWVTAPKTKSAGSFYEDRYKVNSITGASQE